MSGAKKKKKGADKVNAIAKPRNSVFIIAFRNKNFFKIEHNKYIKNNKITSKIEWILFFFSHKIDSLASSLTLSPIKNFP